LRVEAEPEAQSGGPVNGPIAEYFVARRVGYPVALTFEYLDWCQKTRHRLIQVCFMNRRAAICESASLYLPLTTFVLN
jgi:hypothetical protein